MDNKSELMTNNKISFTNVFSCLFGVLVLAIGVLNSFWGNDPEFGVFLILLSFIYYPPVNAMIKRMVGFRIHPVVKILLGIFIIWAALGVGELFAKIEMMRTDL